MSQAEIAAVRVIKEVLLLVGSQRSNSGNLGQVRSDHTGILSKSLGT